MPSCVTSTGHAATSSAWTAWCWPPPRSGAAELRYQRVYPEGDLFAHITGYYSFRLGSTGVERTYNAELTGRTSSLQLRELSGVFSDPSSEGDVILTVQSQVQRTAKDALGTLTGSVVALDPRTGAVLAMYSNPTFDPNLISTNDGQTAADVKTVLDASPEKPLLARSYQERFFPGSTFKVVTATAGLTSGTVTETEPTYPVVRSYTPPLTNRPINNFDRSECGGTLFTILQKSCNSSFAQMAAEQLGPDPMIEAAEAAGFNDTPPIDLTRPAASVYPTDFGDVVSEPEGRAPVVEDTPAVGPDRDRPERRRRHAVADGARGRRGGQPGPDHGPPRHGRGAGPRRRHRGPLRRAALAATR